MSQFFKTSFLFLTFGLFFTVFLTKQVSAADCTLTIDPTAPDQNTDKIIVTLKSINIPPDNYVLALTIPSQSDAASTQRFYFDPSSTPEKSVEFKKLPQGWYTGDHKFDLIQGTAVDKNKSLCSIPFKIAETLEQQGCIVTIISQPIEPGTDVQLKIENIRENKKNLFGFGTDGYDILINNTYKQTYYTDDPNPVSLGSNFFAFRTYTVSIKSRCGFLNGSCIGGQTRLQCPIVGFDVGQTGSGQGGQLVPGTANNPTSIIPCSDPKLNNCATYIVGGCPPKTISSAIGCVNTGLGGFIQDLFKLLVGISGGIAFLMMLLGAFQMITSAGNPETLKSGQDRFTNAIIALLFIIFAVLLMQIIGQGILAIPGFE